MDLGCLGCRCSGRFENRLSDRFSFEPDARGRHTHPRGVAKVLKKESRRVAREISITMQGMQSPIMVMSTCCSRAAGTQIALRLFPAAKGRSAFVFLRVQQDRPDSTLTCSPLSYPRRHQHQARNGSHGAAQQHRRREGPCFTSAERERHRGPRADLAVKSPSPLEDRLAPPSKKRPSLTSRASLPRNPGCLRHHPHHSRSALDAEDDSGCLWRYVSSRERDRAARRSAIGVGTLASNQTARKRQGAL